MRSSPPAALRRIAQRPPRMLWWTLLAGAMGALAIVRIDIAARRSEFQAQARNAERLLGQATSRLDAVLATLALMAGPQADAPRPEWPVRPERPEARLPALYPQVVDAWRRDAGSHWPAAAGAVVAATLPATQNQPAMTDFDAATGRYTLVLAATPASFALRIDARRLVPPTEWPWRDGDPVRVTLSAAGQSLELQRPAPEAARPRGLTAGFELIKPLDSASQPFVLHVQQFTGPAQWPWGALVLWALICAAGGMAVRRRQLERAERAQALEQMRLARVSRLHTMGEFAAGLAHELNQPLTAVLSSTQAALRLLREPDGDGDGVARAVPALELAAAQARRASDVMARLKRLVQPGEATAATAPVDVGTIVRRVADLMAPELDAAGVTLALHGHASAARADAVAVEQIVHNLLLNALQALQTRPEAEAAQRAGHIDVRLSGDATVTRCAVQDNGPGIAAQDAPRLFEPFFSTRADGLGLGLPLCQTLALAMNGQVRLRQSSGGGSEFVLELPTAAAAAAKITPPDHPPRSAQ